MLKKTTFSALSIVSLAVPFWLAGSSDPHPASAPLTYQASPAPSDPAYAGSTLLADDPRGDGRRVAVFGDLDAARYVAVVVPGAMHDLKTFTDPVGPLASARSLYESVGRLDARAAVAVIAWLGYDTPEGFGREVMRSERAEAGARDLLRLGGLVPAGAQVTWLCHSYGTVVCGHASPLARPEHLVLLGSPGTDVETAAELGAGDVYAARATGDAIAAVPFVRVAGYGHGADPTAPGFGARPLDVGDATGHSQYFLPTGSLVDDLARVVLGRQPDRAPRAIEVRL